MMTKDEYRKLLREAFGRSPQWTEWFAANVLSDTMLRPLLAPDGHLLSGMVMRPGRFAMHGALLPAGHIAGAATPKNERGQGYMQRLTADVVKALAREGLALCTVCPRERYRYFGYDAFDFATVFYVDELRYTSVHPFTLDEEMVPAEPVYALFERLENLRPCGMRHDAADFDLAVREAELADGAVVAVSGPDGRAAMAFAVADHTVTVLDVLATDAAAAESALALVRAETGEKPVIVRAEPGMRPFCMRAAGMVRILDPGAVLATVAAAFPRLKLTVRVRDRLIEANNATFRLADGQCVPAEGSRRPDLDVTAGVLARMLFNDPRVGDITGLPSVRPRISLML